MKKVIFLLATVLLVSCSKDPKNSITLGVRQTIKIPVRSVMVSAGIRLESTSGAASVEKKGYKRLAQVVSLLEKVGYDKDQLEINSGEVQNRSYRNKKSYQYRSSVKFTIKDLDKVDATRRALTQKGVNSFSIVEYKNPKEDSLYDAAYRQAIKKAKNKAQNLLSNQQVEVGKILSLSENTNQTLHAIGAKKSANQLVVMGYGAALPAVPPLFNKNITQRKSDLQSNLLWMRNEFGRTGHD